MTADPQQVGQHPAGLLAPVPPSRLVRMVMRPLTRMLNPVVGMLAGRPHFRMAAQIRHVGRRSGRRYVTPEFVSAHDAGPLVRSAFGPLERASFRMLGIRQFITLRIGPAEP